MLLMLLNFLQEPALLSLSYLQELESVSGWLFSSVPAAAASTSSCTPAWADGSTASWGTGASPGGSMLLVAGRGRRRGGGDTQESPAAELLHSGWLMERGQEFPVAPTAAPPGPPRQFAGGSANFRLPPPHRLDPVLPLATSPPRLPAPPRGSAPVKLLLTEGPSAEPLPVLLALKWSPCGGGEWGGATAGWPNHLHRILRICFTSNSFREQEELEPLFDMPGLGTRKWRGRFPSRAPFKAARASPSGQTARLEGEQLNKAELPSSQGEEEERGGGTLRG